MNVYVISDDFFFSLGCENILKKQKSNSIAIKDLYHSNSTKKIKNGDVLLVAIRSHHQALKALECLSNTGARVILFTDLPNKKYYLNSWFGLDIFLSKRIKTSLLMSYIDNLSILTGKNMDIQLLSEREKGIIEMFVNGASLEEISDSLKISKKTIYAHRANSFKKIGLNHANSYFFIGYQNYIANRSTILT